MLSIIAIIGKNRELGRDNKLIWNIHEDLARFRKITAGHPVIMGRKTFESIGRPLPNRINIVITSDRYVRMGGAEVVGSLDEAIERAAKSPGSDEIFVIGGGTVYAQAINRADRLYLTIVDATAEADTFFPDYSRFTKVISKESHKSGEYQFDYMTLELSTPGVE